MKKLSGFGLAFGFVASLAPSSVFGSFHFMQIEQVIGGVNGDTSAQAIQLRMRSAGQNLINQGRMRVHDATGSNPIMVIDFTTDVLSGAGRRILIASPNFASYTNPAVVPDFTMTNLIPDSYLAAGSLTFENNTGSQVLWRLSWGGAAYTGSHLGTLTNDADGNFGPGVVFALPSTSLQAVQFTGASNALSTNNAAQYIVTAGAATVINNAMTSFVVQNAVCATTLGDTDGNNCQSAHDIQQLANCLANAGHVGTTACACSDSDGSASLDLLDMDDLVNDLLNPSNPCP